MAKTSKTTSSKAVKAAKPAGEKKAKVKHAIETRSFAGEAGLRVNVRLQVYNGKYTANALFVAKGEKAQVGCRSWHATQDEAKAAFDKIVAQAKTLGWNDPEPKVKGAKAQKVASAGKFDLMSFPTPVKIATAKISAEEAKEMFALQA